MEYRYARLDAGSVDQIMDLQQRCWTFDQGIFILSSRALIERAFQFDNFVFGVFYGEELAGFITCSVPGRRSSMNLGRQFGFTDEQLDRVGHANMMAIAPEHRRRGIGSRLFQMAMDTFPTHCEYIMITTKLENNLARQLIGSRGFRLEKIVEIGGHQRAIYVKHRMSVENRTTEPWRADSVYEAKIEISGRVVD
jgi:ribosomal protein S18 acetylase RimI-like enzyme